MIVLFALVACGPKAPAPTESTPATSVAAPAQSTTASPAAFQQDFDAAYSFVGDHYCCFADRATDWAAVGSTYRNLAATAPNDIEFFKVLEQMMDELYDPTSQLGTHLASSWRRTPYDMWGELRDGQPLIVAVQPGSDAETQGLRAGDVVVEVGLDEVMGALQRRRPQCLRQPSPEADEWALRSLLAGRYNRVREFRVRRPDGALQFATIKQNKRELPPSVQGEMLKNGTVVLQMAQFDDPGALASFDAAMDQLRAAKGLVLDLRDNPGGDLTVAQAMLGRFLGTPLTYGSMSGDLTVSPRGAWAFTSPVVVLVNHWTEGAAEHLALGLRATGHGYLVGTTMGGLASTSMTLTLPNTGFDVVVATDILRDRTGTPSGKVAPDVGVDLTVAPYGDPIREAGLKKLDELINLGAR